MAVPHVLRYAADHVGQLLFSTLPEAHSTGTRQRSTNTKQNTTHKANMGREPCQGCAVLPTQILSQL